jgi:hypothetical protein
LVATCVLDIFCLVPESGPLVSVAPIYERLRAQGHEVAAEHVVIAGVPVQFIPA